VLGIAALAGAYTLSVGFFIIVVAYLLLNVAYCFAIKHVSILDVFAIAVSFILRVKGGAVIIDVEPSVWIIICTGLLAMFLAIGKRRDDLVRVLDKGHRASLAGYSIQFLDTATTIVLGALFVAYTIYTTNTQVMEHLGTEQLYLTVPFVLAGILRYLQIMVVEERSGTPTKIVLRDRFLITTIIGWIVTFGILIYQ
ncbi:MAG: UbiA prenyltransferase family protein, partial [Alphaproteobacteria bacterium]